MQVIKVNGDQGIIPIKLFAGKGWGIALSLIATLRIQLPILLASWGMFIIFLQPATQEILNICQAILEDTIWSKIKPTLIQPAIW